MNKDLLREQWLVQLPMIAAMIITTSADPLQPDDAAGLAMELIQASADVVDAAGEEVPE